MDQVAAEVVHYSDFSDQLLPVFIEHHERTDEFWLVTFEGDEVVFRQGEETLYWSFGEPERKELDQGSVKRLVGQKL